jgi:hypothetical protein
MVIFTELAMKASARAAPSQGFYRRVIFRT